MVTLGYMSMTTPAGVPSSEFRLAARSPFHDNSQIRAMIEPQMTTDQLNEAKRLVEAWQPREAEELKMLEIALPAAPGAPARLCPAMP